MVFLRCTYSTQYPTNVSDNKLFAAVHIRTDFTIICTDLNTVNSFFVKCFHRYLYYITLYLYLSGALFAFALLYCICICTVALYSYLDYFTVFAFALYLYLHCCTVFVFALLHYIRIALYLLSDSCSAAA